MADEKQADSVGTETKEAQEAPKEADVVTIRKGELAGYKTQLRDMKKALEEFTSARAAEEAAKLKAAADWESLEKKSRAEVESMKAELSKARRDALTATARSALLGAGMNAGLAADGALSLLPSDLEPDAIPEWVAGVKASHPAEFTVPANPIGAPSVGAAARPTGDPASVLKAKVAAAKGKGPAVMAAAMKEVEAHIAATGKNPLQN
jgi:hypothetical protein